MCQVCVYVGMLGCNYEDTPGYWAMQGKRAREGRGGRGLRQVAEVEAVQPGRQ